MTRKRAADGSAPPKAPRVRKKKADAEPKHEPPPFEPMIPNGMMMDDGGGIYTQDYGYAFGSQPAAFDAASHSPFLIPQSSTPQPHMMYAPEGMRPMPPGPGGPPVQQPMNAPTPLEFRIHDMNRRLYIFNSTGVSEKDYAQWWDAFSHEFFADDARLCVVLCDDPTAPEKYMITRALIPRFFRSFVESGIKDLQFVIRGATRELPSPSPTGGFTFENDNVWQITQLETPSCLIEARTECKLFIEFSHFDEMLNHRIRNWTIELRNCLEYFTNDITKDFQLVDMEKQRSTRLGLTAYTLQCLAVSRILEPMAALMTESKNCGGHDPRDTMKRVLFQQQKNHLEMQQRMHQQSMHPPPADEPKPKPARKRTRKPAANAKSKKANASPAPSNPSFPPNPNPNSFTGMGYQDVMVVGEPSMMGGDYGEEDERTISRVENTQYDPNALQMQQAMGGMPPGMMGGPGMVPGGPGPMGHMAPPNGMPPQHSMGGPPMGGPPMGGPPMGGPPMGGPPNGQSIGHMGAPQNGLPPPYYGQPQGSWPGQAPNTAMITS